MAGRMRDHDWTATPLGPTETWPQALRTAVEMALASPLVSSLVCGPDRILIYNDAAAVLYGTRHPAALGRPLPETFPEGWRTVAPLYERVFTGESIQVTAQPLDTRGEGEAASNIFDAVLIPLRDEQGRVAYAHMTGFEVGGRLRAEAALRESEERQAFLLKLSDALRAEPNADAIANCALRMLIAKMQLDRSYITVYRLDENRADVTHQLGNDRVPPLPEMFVLSDFPEAFRALHDRTFVIEDDFERQGLSDAEKHNSRSLGMRAMVAPTLRKGESHPLWSMVAISAQPRRWTRGEITLVEEVAERTWAAMERACAEEALRESEGSLRVIMDNVPAMIGFYDREFRYRAINEEFSRFFKRPKEGIIGRTVAEIAGERIFASLKPWMERTLAGETVRCEDQGWRAADPNLWGWTEENYIPHFAASGEVDGFYALVFDITERKKAEEALRESEERFRALATAGSYMMYRMSPDWRHMYQLSGEGMLADTVEPVADWADTYLLPEDQPVIFAAIEEAIRTKSLFELEHRVRQVNGGVGWVLSRAVPILGPDGNIVEWFGTGVDVTAKRKVEEKLREAEERYRGELEQQVRERTADLQASRDLLQATMDSSMDMIQVFEAVRDGAGEIVDFRWVLNNHTSESRYGKVEGESLLTRNPGVVQEGIFGAFKRVTETGRPEQAERHYVHEQFDGWFYQSVVKLGDGVATTTKEITEWKKAQEEVVRLRDAVAQAKLRESEEKYRSLFETLGQGYAECELIRGGDGHATDLRYIALNPALERLSGLKVAETVGRTAREAVPGIEESQFEMYEKIVDAGVPERREYEVAPLGRWYECYVYPTKSDRFFALYEDITERKRRERNAELMAEIGQDLSVLSSPDEIIQTVGARLGHFLHASGCIFADVDEVNNEATIHHGWNATDVPSLKQTFRLADYFGDEFARAGRAGETVIVCDTARDERADADAYARLKLGAFITVPFQQQGRWIANITVTTREPRTWRADEIELLQEIANRVFPRIERARAEAALRESEERFRQFADASSDVLWIRDAQTMTMEYLNPAFERVYGHPRQKVLAEGLGEWGELIHPEDRDMALEKMECVRRGERITHEFRLLHPDGGIRWIENTDFPLFDMQGKVQRIGGYAKDVTEKKEIAERMKVLVAELQHRTRNLIVVVRSIADRTLATSSSLDEFRGRFRDRMGALGRVNGLLSQLNERDRISFDELIRTELAGHGVVDGEGHEQVTLEGPKGIRLRSATVQSFALGLHELATNAVKHGALSRPEGRLAIRWGLVPGQDGEPRLRVEWQESGVTVPPPARGQPYRRGSGRELIERSLPYQLGADTSYELTPEGVRCTITLPISTMHWEAEHA
ncbi:MULTISPECIES: PAS domain-containing protein [Microvirga]|uniref:PAS domain-containing protein n=1 Tax=Microvirga TaxID=186650 RepID=UPI001FFD1484|nr:MULTISPECIES: PAS domain-containing protein [unclassified Microvirga]